MRILWGILFWAIFLTLTISMLIHLFNEPGNGFVNALGLVIIMFLCLAALATDK
jgi:hypothetical protein